MTPATAVRSLVVALAALALVVSPALAPAATAAGAGQAADTLVVGGDGAYDTIGGALEAAGDGDVVVVRPGTYEEAVTVDADVTIRAPDGATLDATGLDAEAVVTVAPDATVVLEGLAVVGDAVGLDVSGNDGDWRVLDSTFRGFERSGVDTGAAIVATNATGDWRVANSTFVDSDVGVDARHSTGRWRVANSTFRDNGFGVDATRTTGRWAVRNSTFVGHRDGVTAWYAAGEWVVADSTFADNEEGLYTTHTSGAWLVVRTTFRNNSQNGLDAGANAADWTVEDSVFEGNNYALFAEGAGGNWTVRNTIFVGSDRTAIWALGAEHEGDATRNWWGVPEGQDVDDCWGNVDCTDPLAEPPVDDPAYRNRTDDTAWNETATVATVTGVAETGTKSESLVGTPGFGVVVALLATLGACLLVVRRAGR